MAIGELYRLICKRWMLIALCIVAFGGIAAAVSFLVMDDVYEASAVMIVSTPRNTDKNLLTLNDYDLSVKLVNSYRVLCKTDRILSQVLAQTKLPLTIKELSKKIEVTAQSNTEIISIAVRDTNPATAAQLANAVTSVFMKEIPQIMHMDNVQVIDSAVAPQLPVLPDRVMIIGAAVLLGLMTGLGLAWLIGYFDVSVKSPEQLAALLEAPMLGTVPHLAQRRHQK